MVKKALIHLCERRIRPVAKWSKVEMDNSNRWKAFHSWGWVLALSSLLLSIDSYCSFRFFYIWNVSPSRLFLVSLSVIAFITGLLGLKSHRNRMISVFTILLSLGLIFSLLLAMTFLRVTRVQTLQSPNHNYTISFYMVDTGAGVSPISIGYVDGPLWVKRRFYTAGTKEAPNHITWRNNSTILKINGHQGV